MLGLEYLLQLNDIQHNELAEQLGIKKQNINLWIKGKQNIPKKYLPVLSDLFQVDVVLLSKQLTEIEQLELQKEKLKRDLKPIITKTDAVLSKGAEGFTQKPIYNKEEINSLDSSIEKAKLLERLKQTLDYDDKHPYMDSYRIMVELFERALTEPILHKTLQGLAHYLGVLPDDITTGEEQQEFESDLFEVFDDNNY